MRKDTKIIVMKNYNDFMGGMYNAYLDGNLKECYENLNDAEDVVDAIYLNAITEKSEIKFDGEENIKDFIIDLMMKDKEGQEAIRALRKK